MPTDSDYKTVERSIRYLEENFRRQPSLEELSSHAGMSTFHFQKVFTRWAGVSPKRFLQFLTLEHAKDLLRNSEPVLATAFASGLSGPARLHDLFVHTEGVTPGEYKKLGMSLEITYGFHDTPFGTALLGNTERGLCHLVFSDSDEASGREAVFEAMKEEWPGATLREARHQTGDVAKRIFYPRKETKCIRLVDLRFGVRRLDVRRSQRHAAPFGGNSRPAIRRRETEITDART